MESNYTENSIVRWIVSGCIAIGLMLLCLLLLIQEEKNLFPDIGPLMELTYVTVENNTVLTPPKIPKVQPKQIKNEPIKEPTPQPVFDIPEIPDVPVEPAGDPQPDISAGTAPTKPIAVEQGSSEVQRIGTIAELDNTDFVPIYNPKPDYPVAAQAAHISGYVDIDLTISGQGQVESFTIIETRGHPLFAVETAKVLPRWRFPPPRIGGKKVRVLYTYRVSFTLN